MAFGDGSVVLSPGILTRGVSSDHALIVAGLHCHCPKNTHLRRGGPALLCPRFGGVKSPWLCHLLFYLQHGGGSVIERIRLTSPCLPVAERCVFCDLTASVVA